MPLDPHQEVALNILNMRQQEFRIAYANAMLGWQGVEEQIFLLFCNFSGLHPPIAGPIFYSISGFNNAVRMVDAVAQATQPADELAIWTSLKKRVLAAAQRRNSVAHGALGLVEDGPNSKALALRKQPVHEWMAPTEEPLTLSRLEAVGRGFTELNSKLMVFGAPPDMRASLALLLDVTLP